MEWDYMCISNFDVTFKESKKKKKKERKKNSCYLESLGSGHLFKLFEQLMLLISLKVKREYDEDARYFTCPGRSKPDDKRHLKHRL